MNNVKEAESNQMKHYIEEETGYAVDIKIPDDIVARFFSLFVEPNTTDGKINVSKVLDAVKDAEWLVYKVEYQYEISNTLYGLGGCKSAEKILADDKISLFILDLLKLFESEGYFVREFPLFFHNTMMDLSFNMYTFE